MKKLAILAVSALVLSGCSTVQERAPTRQTGSFPEIGKITTVNVGQVMVSEYDYLSSGSATLLEKIEGGFWSGRKDVNIGTSLTPAISSGEDVFCDTPRMGAACVKDTNHDGKFDHAYTMDAFGLLVKETSIPPAAYRVSDRVIKDGFKYELLYEGIDNGVVRIAYREYSESLARPAFAQDLTYTLNHDGGAKIRFRKVAASIRHADNNQIEYVVDSNF